MSLRLDRKKSLRQLVGRLQDVTDRQTRQIERNFQRHGIELIAGNARASRTRPRWWCSARTAPSCGGFPRTRFSSPRARLPSAPGIAMRDPDLVDSDRILDLDRVPTTLTVVGGGVIGTEYACLFAALGTRVTLVEGRDRLLGDDLEGYGGALQLSLGRMGAEVLLGDAVESVERMPGLKTEALRLKLKSRRALTADKVLFSAGRSGNTADLNLAAAGVAVTKKGRIPVNEHFQTNVPNIYAAGDVIGAPALAATAMEQGRVAMCHAFQIAFKTSVSAFQPYGIYTIPEISTIGPSEQDLKARGIAYETGHARFENNARGQITGDADGFVKILFDPKTRRLLSAHILGEHATELIHIPMFVLSSEARLTPSSTRSSTTRPWRRASSTRPTMACSGSRRERAAAPTAARKPLPPAMRPWFAGLCFAGRLRPDNP
jgi:NAD(P) transhydrogenase